jgi:hypothetical protein
MASKYNEAAKKPRNFKDFPGRDARRPRRFEANVELAR